WRPRDPHATLLVHDATAVRAGGDRWSRTRCRAGTQTPQFAIPGYIGGSLAKEPAHLRQSLGGVAEVGLPRRNVAEIRSSGPLTRAAARGRPATTVVIAEAPYATPQIHDAATDGAGGGGGDRVLRMAATGAAKVLFAKGRIHGSVC